MSPPSAYSTSVDPQAPQEYLKSEVPSTLQVSEEKGADGISLTIKNSDASPVQLTIHFHNFKNVAFPAGTPCHVTVGPGKESTVQLCKQKDSNAVWLCKYRWQSRAVRSTFEKTEDKPGAFIDNDFPADNSSLGKSDSEFSCATSADLWVRAPDLGVPGHAILFEGIHPNDIRQGDLGDCWLMAAMAKLADYPDRVKGLFSSQKVSESGKYDISLFDIQTMKWTTITIDDLIPCNMKNGVPEPLFANPDGEEIWALLLEKAFAKFCGTYGALSGGMPSFAFQAMTGQIVTMAFKRQENGIWHRRVMSREEQVKQGARNPRNAYWTWMNDDEKKCCKRIQWLYNKDQLWKRFSSSSTSNHLMTCIIEDDTGGAEGKGEAGLLTKHLYSLLQAADVTLDNGSREKLVKLRNPWGGDAEWVGDWGDSSSKWEQNPKLAKTLSHEMSADGTFWMSWDDWARNFSWATICPKDMISGKAVEDNHMGAEGEADIAHILGLPPVL